MTRATVRWLPRSVMSLARRSGGSALANARAAAATVGAAVADRTELTRLLFDEQLTTDSSGALRPMSADECLRLLSSRSVGRLAYIARAGVPDIVPVNYTVRDGDILIRSGPGPKLQAAERRELVAFEVDQIDEGRQVGWSVVVHGSTERMAWTQERHGDAPRAWAAGPRQHLIRVSPRRMTGRRLQGPDR